MGGRDHAEECPVCGYDRGGMNDSLCMCEMDAARKTSAVQAWSAMERRVLAAESARDNAVGDFVYGHARRLAELHDGHWDGLDADDQTTWAAEVHDVLNNLTVGALDGEIRDGRRVAIAAESRLAEMTDHADAANRIIRDDWNEIKSLRALLREARPWVIAGDYATASVEQEATDLRGRIDAVLEKEQP